MENDIRVLQSRSELVMEPVIKLYDYWLKLREDLVAPSPDLFDVLNVPDLVPHLARITLDEDTNAWNVRFHGQDSVLLTGMDLTGATDTSVDNPSAFGERSLNLVRMVINFVAPVVNGPNPLQIEGREHVTMQSIGVPFARDGKVVEIIAIMATDGDWQDEKKE